MVTHNTSKNDRNAKNRVRSVDVILGLLPLILGFELIVCISYLPTALRGHADFRNFYSAGLIVRSGRGRELYNYDLQRAIQNNATITPSSNVLPYVHLPYESLLFAPFTVLKYSKAFLCFLSLNTIFLVIAYFFWRKRLLELHYWRWFPVLLFIGFAPISVTLIQGQDSILTLLFFSAALTSLNARRDMIAGASVGLALYKPQLVVPIAVLFLLWRQWRFIAGLGLSASFLLLISAMITGPGRLLTYIFSLPHISNILSTGNTVMYVMPVSSMPNIRGMILAIPRISGELKSTLVIVVSLLLLVAAFWAGRQKSSEWRFAVAISTTTLIGYHVLMHDLSILLIPMAILLMTGRAMWTLPLVWLSAPLCFFGYSAWVTLPSLVLFMAIALLARQYGYDSEIQSQDLNFAELNVSQCC